MRIINLVPIALLVSACGRLPVDGTPAWDTANRYAVEQVVDCNTTLHSVGLSGCAFKEDNVKGSLTLPALWTSALSFTSAQCTNFTLVGDAVNDNVIDLSRVGTSLEKSSCSYSITRSVTEKKMPWDRSAIGRFFLKIVPNSPYYTFLRFTTDDKNMFTGVGWHQRKFGKFDPVLKVYPSGKEGMFTMLCGSDIAVRMPYTTSPFEVTLNSEISCDYEMAAVNSDNPYIEFATYMHEVSQYTVDISAPSVTTSSKSITFTFNDKAIDGIAPAVIGVKIDNGAPCTDTNKCKSSLGKPAYTVKAATAGARFFWGTYTVATQTWEVK